MENKTILLGYENYIKRDRIVAILNIGASPALRFIKKAEENGMLLDVTAGKKRKSVVVTDAGYVFVTAKGPKTISTMVEET